MDDNQMSSLGTNHFKTSPKLYSIRHLFINSIWVYLIQRFKQEKYLATKTSPMIPKEITPQLVRLKEKTKNYSAISRSYKIDEIRSDIAIINDEITGLNRDINNILVDGLGSKIEIENWFGGLMDRSEFIEPNPRIIYEEEQREIEHQKRLSEEKKQLELEELQKRQKQDRIDAFRKLLVYGTEDIGTVKEYMANGINVKDDISGIDLYMLFNHGRSLQFIELLIDAGMKITENDRIELERQKGIAREREKQKKLEAENDAWEAEERQTRLQAQQRIDEFRKICLDKQTEDLDQLHNLIEKGLDVNCINDFDGLTKIVFWSKSLSFIKVLIDSGLHITEKNVLELYSKYEYRYNEAELLDLLISAKDIDPEALKKVKKTVANRKQEELERKKSRILEEQKQRIEEFKKMCQYGQENIFKLKELMNDGLDVTKIADFDCLISCLECRKPADFIRFLVDSGILVTNKHIKYCYANTKYFTDATSLIYILENAKNLDSKALEDILKRKKSQKIAAIIGIGILVLFIGIFFIFKDEMITFFKVIGGILLIPLLLPILLKKR